MRESFRAFVQARIPADCKVEFHEHGGSPAIQLSYDSPELTKAKNALSDEWPKPAVIIGMGGSIRLSAISRRCWAWIRCWSVLA